MALSLTGMDERVGWWACFVFYCLFLFAGLFLVALAPAQGLSDLRADLKKAEDLNAGIRTLEGLVKLYVPDSEDAAKMTDAVGEALELPNYEVRAWALDLLQNQLDRVRLMDALSRASVALRKEWEALEKAMKKGKAARKPARGSEGIDKDTMSDLNELFEAVRLAKEAAGVRADYRLKFVEVLCARAEDAVVDALDEILQTARGGYADPIQDELLRLATPEALSVVLDAIKPTEEHVAERAKEHKKLSRPKIEKEPKYWRGTKATWETRQLKARDAALDVFREYDRKLGIWSETF